MLVGALFAGIGLWVTLCVAGLVRLYLTLHSKLRDDPWAVCEASPHDICDAIGHCGTCVAASAGVRRQIFVRRDSAGRLGGFAFGSLSELSGLRLHEAHSPVHRLERIAHGGVRRCGTLQRAPIQRLAVHEREQFRHALSRCGTAVAMHRPARRGSQGPQRNNDGT